MPYIAPEQRSEYEDINDLYIETPGQLAYCVALCVKKFMRSIIGPVRFYHLALVVGTLILSALEFWRRGVVPYEEEQMKKNGDVL